MSSAPRTARLTLHLDAGTEADAEELDRLTRQLRDEIRDLEVESVELVRGETPPGGAKSVNAVTLGALAVAIPPEVLPKLMELLQSWLLRGDRTLKIKTQVGDRLLEVEYSPRTMSPAELKSLVDTLTEAIAEQR
jgi:hypothetical protein